MHMMPGWDGDQVTTRNAGGHLHQLVLRNMAFRAAADQQRRRGDRAQAVSGRRVARVDLGDDGRHHRPVKVQ